MFITLVGKEVLHLWEIFLLRLWEILLHLWELLHLWKDLLHLWELLHLKNFITIVGPTGMVSVRLQTLPCPASRAWSDFETKLENLNLVVDIRDGKFHR